MRRHDRTSSAQDTSDCVHLKQRGTDEKENKYASDNICRKTYYKKERGKRDVSMKITKR